MITPSQMQFGHYYVVEVAFNKNNPIHRAIAFNAQTGGRLVWLMRAGYERRMDHAGHIFEHTMPVDRTKLTHFRVIEEITAMRPDNDPFSLPRKP
jgi:hypothetical protein